MWLNKNDSTIIDKPKGITIGDKDYPSCMFSQYSEAELNLIGIYKFIEDTIPNRRYYTYNEVIDMVNANTTRTPIDDLVGAKDKMLADLKAHKQSKQDGRPIVDTGLGFSVDGGYRDLQNLQGAKTMGLLFCIDVDGITHTIALADWDTIIGAVMANGLNIIMVNGAKKAEIMALATVADCILYEATPYDYVVTQADVDADIDGTLVLGAIQVRYLNNVTNW